MMLSVPGVYSIGHKISRQKRLRLVSVRAAKELGVMFHGSVENIAETLATRRTVAITKKEVYTYLQMAPQRPIGSVGPLSVHSAK
jgi:hypothetical protein